MSTINVPARGIGLGMHMGAFNPNRPTINHVGWAQLPNRDNYFAHLQAKGIRSVRATFNWEDVLDTSNPEATNNIWNYAAFIQSAYLHGVQVHAIIHESTKTGIIGATRDQHLRDLTNWVYNNWGPDGTWWSAWGYARDKTIIVYEIFNEPNGSAPLFSADHYGQMIAPIYTDLRCPSGHNDGRVMVMCGGIRNANSPGVWLEAFVNSGNFYCDHVCCHPYPDSNSNNNTAENFLGSLGDVLQRHSTTQKLFITEYGFGVTSGQADQLAKWQEFKGWCSAPLVQQFVLGIVQWWPGWNTAAQGQGPTVDMRLGTVDTNWTTFVDRSVVADFVANAHFNITI